MREEIDVIAVNEGIELYVEDVGPEDAPAVVVLHGGPGGSGYALREGFGEELEEYRAVYFDQRGGGRSPEVLEENELFTVDALVDDLEHLRDHLGLGGWRLLGHGFGAVLALEYARRHPGKTEGLVLVNPWTNFPWLAQQLYRASLGLRGLPQADIEVELPDDPERLLAEAFAQSEPKALFDRLMFPTQHSRMEFEWVAEGSTVVGAEGPGLAFVRNGLWRLDYTSFLLEVHAPVAVIVGSEDGTSYPEAQAVADLTGGSLEAIPRAGHYPWVDDPYAFAEALRGALAGAE